MDDIDLNIQFFKAFTLDELLKLNPIYLTKEENIALNFLLRKKILKIRWSGEIE